MVNDIAPYLAHLREHATSSLKHFMAVAEYMEAVTDNLPDDLKPTRQVLIEITMQALIGSYAESLKLISELGLQEITQGAQGSQRSIPSVGCPSHQEAAENKWRE